MQEKKKVKSYGSGGLHITLSSKKYSLGQDVLVVSDGEEFEGWITAKIRGIVQEEIENLKESMRGY